MNRRIPKPSARADVALVAAQSAGYLLSVALGLFALFTLAGCAEPVPVSQSELVTGYVFSPDDGLEDAVLDAGASLSYGSGLDVVSGDGGVIVRWWGPDDGDVPDCAHTTVTFDKHSKETLNIEIAVKDAPPEGCIWPLSVIVEHEMIHALNNWGSFTGNENGEHSEHGLFQAFDQPDDFALEETSLSALCTYAPCTAFNPE